MKRGVLLCICACAFGVVACAVGGKVLDEDSGTPPGTDGGGSDVVTPPKDGGGDGGKITCTSPEFLCGDAGCVDLTSNATHCGQCGTVCETADAGGLVQGENGNPDAGVPTPDGGFPDAGEPWSLGTPTCAKSNCGVTCPSAMTLCTDGVCYDTQQFHDHCGDCNTACQTAEYCAKGHCCATGTQWCGASCIDILSDTNNCGACGNVCQTNYSCVGGVCSSCSNANVALTATATHSGGGSGSYGPTQMNNGVLETSSCTTFEWVNGSSSPGTDWVQYTWSSAKKLVKMHVDTTTLSANSCGYGRTLAGAQIQWWNGSSWVTDGTVSSQTNDWDYTFTTQVTTTQVRLYGVYANPSSAQASNPIIYEWQVTGCN